MWATRPHLASIFEKLLEQKTFYLPAARCLQPISKNNSNKKAECVFSVLCFCLLCDIRNPKPCICNNLNQGIICNRMG
mgnify:CR=1 FL=1